MGGTERLARAYVAGLELCAVIVFGRGQQVRVGYSAEPARRARELGKGVMVASEHWCIEEKLAVRIVDRCAEMLGDGWLETSPEHAKRLVTECARELNVMTETSVRIQERATAAVASLDATIADFRRTGQMQSINRSYREYRERANAERKPALVYSHWIWNFKIRMAKELAQSTRLTLLKNEFGRPGQS